MINSPESSIILSDSQNAQINEYQRRISNIEGEASIANKNLKILKSEIEKSVAEKVYQENLHAEIFSKTEQSQNILSGLLVKIEQEKEKLSDIKKLSDSLNMSNIVKNDQFIGRENELIEKEKVHNIKVEQYTVSQTELLRDKEKVETAKEAIAQALETLQSLK